jgi:hypothetical protein
MVGGALATLALVATLGVTSVFAQSSDSSSPSAAQTFIDRLAQNLGLSSDQVKQGLQKTQEQYVDDAVSSGKLTPQQGDAAKQRIESGQSGPFVFLPGHGGKGGRFGHGGIGMGMDMDLNAVASTLKLTPQQLHDALASGKTLKQVISDQGSTVDQVVNAVVAQEKTELDKAVTAGRLTSDQESQRLSDLTQKLTDAINNTPVGPRGFDHHGWGGPQPQPQQKQTPTT